MQSLAQKKARENFKKAIEYRKKTGCSLKQAFAHIKGKITVVKKKATPKKVAGYVKTIKKGAKTEVLYTNVKNAAKVKKYSKALKLIPGSAKQKSLFGVKKKTAKKPSEQSILNKIHKVKKDVDRLDEAQHKHMSIGSVKHELIEKLMKNNKDIATYDARIIALKNKMTRLDKNEKIIARHIISEFKKIQSEIKTHSRELKKHI
jgi:hypothetical protein